VDDLTTENDSTGPGSQVVRFAGGIHVRRFVGGVGAPIGGHLEVGRDHLRFWGLGFDVRVRRQDAEGVRFGPGINATRISAVLVKPSQEQFFWLSTKHPDPIRAALLERGWPVTDDDNFDLGVADEFRE
jgi:hypothetical protein